MHALSVNLHRQETHRSIERNQRPFIAAFFSQTRINSMKKILAFFFLSLFVPAAVFAAAPTVPASNLSFNSLDGAQFSGSYTNGNGTYRIVVVKKGSPVVGTPTDGVEYNANSAFGTAASPFTQAGEYVVAKTSWNNF